MILYQVGDHDTRPWGTWEVVAVGVNSIIKRITVLPDKLLSLQLHHHRNEHWIVTEGTAEITLGDRIFTAETNTAVYIEVEQKHRIANRTDKPLVVIEIQTGETLDENDIVRFEDSYGRV